MRCIMMMRRRQTMMVMFSLCMMRIQHMHKHPKRVSRTNPLHWWKSMSWTSVKPIVDVYTQSPIGLKEDDISVEHIIPRRIWKGAGLPSDAMNNIYNLVPCDRQVNRIRSDYRYGRFCMEDVSKPIVYDKRHRIAGYIDHGMRVFYPHPNRSDTGLLGRSIVQLLYRYPVLYRYFYDIVQDPECLSEWTTHPQSSLEMYREMYINNSLPPIR